MASNYLDVHNQLQAAGLLVDDLDVGRLRRCRVEGEGRERKGWYWLHEIRLDDGTEVLVGSYGVWRGADSNTEKVKLNLTSKPNREQSEAIRKRLAEDRRRAEGARKAEAQRAAQRATAAWKRYQPTGESEYLQRKGVGAYGLRFADNGTLIIPLLDAQNHIHGLQVVRGKSRAAGKMEKEYWPAGLEKKGKFHLIGLAQDGGILLLAEGYATGASLHACTGLPVAVAFDANNLAPVAAALTKRYKGLRVLVCADDDNTQRCHAENAQATAEAGRRVECKTRFFFFFITRTYADHNNNSGSLRFTHRHGDNA
jgi:putative DNA primase/helicase